MTSVCTSQMNAKLYLVYFQRQMVPTDVQTLQPGPILRIGSLTHHFPRIKMLSESQPWSLFEGLLGLSSGNSVF